MTGELKKAADAILQKYSMPETHISNLPESDNDWWAEQEQFGAPGSDEMFVKHIEPSELKSKAKDFDPMTHNAARIAEGAKRLRSQDWVAEAYLEDHPSARSEATPPKPSQVNFKKIAKVTQKVAKVTQKTTTAFKQLGEEIGQVEKNHADDPTAPMMQIHPFHTPEMVALRESLAKNE